MDQKKEANLAASQETERPSKHPPSSDQPHYAHRPVIPNTAKNILIRPSFMDRQIWRPPKKQSELDPSTRHNQISHIHAHRPVIKNTAKNILIRAPKGSALE
jgi:hypothetical protein